MAGGLQETFYISTEQSRERALRIIASAPIYDEHDRQLVIIAKRVQTAYGASKKRRFHAYVNLLADYKEVPPPAMKETLKAHLCPLVEQIDVITGETKWVPKGVRDLTDEEAAELCEKTIKLAEDEWELPLPVTDEEWTLTKYGGIEALLERKAALDRQRSEES